MAGGSLEYVMGLKEVSTGAGVPAVGYIAGTECTGFTGTLWSGKTCSGIRSLPSKKYYDLYAYPNGPVWTDFTNGKIGDALAEIILGAGDDRMSWNTDQIQSLSGQNIIFYRGGTYSSSSSSGIFNCNSFFGAAQDYITFRVVMILV